MIRAQRARHARMWALLAPALVAAVVLLWLVRPQRPAPDGPATPAGRNP